MSKTYNGFKNWNHWNVSLWINNDEGLYEQAKWFASQYPRKMAVLMMFEYICTIEDDPKPKTPDGAPYSVSSIRAAMVGM